VQRVPVIDIENLKLTEGALLGIDPGTKTFGLAVSDSTRLIASPLFTIRRTKFSKDSQTLLQTFDEKNAVAIVVGMPINMDGSHGARSQSVRDFCTNLLKMRDLKIFLWDERLSSAAVERTLLAGDISRKKRAENIDKMAAAYILQGVLDRLRN